MCTAASYRTKDLYFGRNLDYEFSYGDEVTITPRNYPFTFRRAGEMRTHYAMIGMAYVAEEYPLYYDAVNEKGLCIAGLNFVGNAACQSETDGRRPACVRESCRGADQQPAVPAADGHAGQLPRPQPPDPEKHFRSRRGSAGTQPRHGRHRPAGRSFLDVPLCQRGLYPG